MSAKARGLLRSPALLLLPALLTIAPFTAAADGLKIDFGGLVQTDLRFQVQEKSIGEFYNKQTIPTGIARNENFLRGRLGASYGDFGAKAEIDFVWIGFSNELTGIQDLTLREELQPYRLEAHALYAEAVNLFTDGLDLRVGQQLVLWGKGDQFNPTNNLNANDIEDKLLFGEQQANMMVRLDYTLVPSIEGDEEPWWDSVTFSGVLVPVFKPALLPKSAALGLGNPNRLPFTADGLRHRLITEAGFSKLALDAPTVVVKATPELPETSFDNMQFSFRAAGSFGGVDVALSYYNGRTDIPQPIRNVTGYDQTPVCDPQNPQNCVGGLLETEVTLGYPRVQVAGLNISGEANILGWISDAIAPIGYWLELGVYFPQPTNLALYQKDQILTAPPGEYPYGPYEGPDGRRPLVVESTPFAKWTLGFDYTFNKYVYLNVQWVHGMVDEYGAGDWITEGWASRDGAINFEDARGAVNSGCIDLADATQNDGSRCAEETLLPRLGDYLVLGLDLKFLADRLLVRLFTIWALSGAYTERWEEDQQKRVRTYHSMFTSKGFSAVIYPEIGYDFGYGFHLGMGALVQLGQDHTKFGDPAAGGSMIWTRARFSY